MKDLFAKGKWNEVKGKFKQKYGQLTDDDVTYMVGQDDEFIGNLKKKLGKTKDEVKAEIKEFLN